ncbi:hypothetical protein SAMN05216275_117148 [Streptosporangium canum]|uniref:Lipoprotein n=1 Tax=Streptosporangium canum TaxID=324952 RepID=A0A1I3WUQ5_9ACTN|nr:hypothetical protein [Streptosporangium canum]SFK11238.1 hypothetical protein SAMN05216275_117148 [Streptosporangium canum]
MPKRSTLVLSALSLAALTGCSAAGGSQSAPSSPHATASYAGTDVKRQMEAGIADCMKKGGFTYVPYLPPPVKLSAAETQALNGDYEAMKVRRAKYGFEIFAAFVYPKEFQGPGDPRGKVPADPNWAIAGKLNEAQATAYVKVKEACYGEAVEKTTGKVVTSKRDHGKQMALKVKQVKAEELDGDPGLVQSAVAMADCLKAKGYRLTAANPVAMERRGRDEFDAKVEKLARQDDIPDEQAGEGMFVQPELAPDKARPYLNEEIKASLDDLECGKEFYRAFLPRQNELLRRMQEEFAWL